MGGGGVGEAFSASRLATPSWMAFLRESESVLRLVGAGAGTKTGEVLVVWFDEKSRLTVVKPERGCRSSCIVVSTVPINRRLMRVDRRCCSATEFAVFGGHVCVPPFRKRVSHVLRPN